MTHTRLHIYLFYNGIEGMFDSGFLTGAKLNASDL